MRRTTVLLAASGVVALMAGGCAEPSRPRASGATGGTTGSPSGTGGGSSGTGGTAGPAGTGGTVGTPGTGGTVGGPGTGGAGTGGRGGTGGATATGGRGGMAGSPGGSSGTIDGGVRDTAAPTPSVDVGPVVYPDAGSKAELAAQYVFNMDKLHVINIVLPAEHVAGFETGKDLADPPRYPATFTFDGVTLPMVGIRQGSGGYQAFRKINDKPSISVDFNKFVPMQHLFGLEKVYLKNMAQDQSLMNEHMAYDVFRRAGVPYSLTSYAVVTINGVQSGIYLIRENKNKDFLERNLGKGFEEGNLYEQTYGKNEFMEFPRDMNLKNEVEDMRKRDDLLAFVAAANSTVDANWPTRVGQHLDIDQFITYWATCAVLAWLDNYPYGTNNYFLYNHPKNNKFIFMPHGADEAFWTAGVRLVSIDPTLPANDIESEGNLSAKMRTVPALKSKWMAEIARVSGPTVWNKSELMARVAQVATVLEMAPKTGRAMNDYRQFTSTRPMLEAFIMQGGLTK